MVKSIFDVEDFGRKSISDGRPVLHVHLAMIGEEDNVGVVVLPRGLG